MISGNRGDGKGKYIKHSKNPNIFLFIELNEKIRCYNFN